MTGAWVSARATAAAIAACALVSEPLHAQLWRPRGDAAPTPRTYVAYRAAQAVQVDGVLRESGWNAVPWSEPFVDIVTARRAELPTRVKMMWDDEYLYVGAQLDEPHVWATLVRRDTVIYLDDDFEVFLDPNGDTHGYYELEINAFGTEWDLLLEKPYRDGGPARTDWDIRGLLTAVRVDGTVNDPGDHDRGWTVELAIPFAALSEDVGPGSGPHDGEQWRVNFSRVDWPMTIVEGAYRKLRHATADDPHPESNWVWSPQGAINMHMPEMWGVVQFSRLTAGAGVAVARPLDDADARWRLRRVYYAQREYRDAYGSYADTVAALDGWRGHVGFSNVTIHRVGRDDYRATTSSNDGTTVLEIRGDGRVRRLSHGGQRR